MKIRQAWAVVAFVGLSACSPSLNWRTVPVEQLAALLPCKPDFAERKVALGGVQRTLSMWGCEAGGALFAVSHLRADATATPQQVVAAWQLAALRNMPGATAQVLAFNAPTLAGQAALPGTMVRATGKGADGSAVQAQLAWFSRDANIYHLAVFAPALSPALTDTFFTELHWQ